MAGANSSKLLKLEQFELAAFAIGHHDPLAGIPGVGHEPPRADLAADVEIEHQRARAGVLGQCRELGEYLPAEPFGVGLFHPAGRRLDSHLLLQPPYLVDDLLGHAYVIRHGEPSAASRLFPKFSPILHLSLVPASRLEQLRRRPEVLHNNTRRPKLRPQQSFQLSVRRKAFYHKLFPRNGFRAAEHRRHGIIRGGMMIAADGTFG